MSDHTTTPDDTLSRPPAICGHWLEVRQSLGVYLASSRTEVEFIDNKQTTRRGRVMFWPGRFAAPNAPKQPMVNTGHERHPVLYVTRVYWRDDQVGHARQHSETTIPGETNAATHT